MPLEVTRPLKVFRHWAMLPPCLLWAIILSGCASLPLRDAVPERLASTAELPGLSQVRVWGDEAGGALQRFMTTEAAQAKSRRSGVAKGRAVTDHILAISGGADDGAFGAGLLVGWSKAGTRPEFAVVTGISAGALIAPFAFLGTGYDRHLEALFIQYGGDDIYRANVVSGLLGGMALADSAPLAALIAKYVDKRMVARLAEERAKGRLLIIGTTNLDAQRPVFWDIGRIAQSSRPDAIDTIRNILLASASLPGLFPPVKIKVSAGDKTFEELHVDGGPTREVFLAPNDFSFQAFDRRVGQVVTRKLWVIRNGKLQPEYAPVDATALAISARSIATLTKYQGIGDLARIFHKTQTEGVDFNLASIPIGFSAPRAQPFDRAYMKALFDVGVTFGKSGASWAKVPPGVMTAVQ